MPRNLRRRPRHGGKPRLNPGYQRPGPTSPGRGCGRAQRRLQDAMPVTAQIRWAARYVDRSGAPAAAATPAEIRKSEGDPRNHLPGRGAQPAARPGGKDSTRCALWRCGSNGLIFSFIHPQEAERWPTSRASPSISIFFATSALPKIQRKKKEKGSQYDMKYLPHSLRIG